MTNNERKEEQAYLKKQLFIETFQKSDEEFSPERVDALVRMLETNEPTDPDEIKESQREFEVILNKKIVRKPAYRIRKFAQATAVLCLVLFGANITTKAFMDESLLHVIQSIGNRMEVLPGDTDVNHSEVREQIFEDIDSFDEAFTGNFLVCSWLPEKYSLDEIICVSSENFKEYYWNYLSENNQEITISMYNKRNNEIASVSGTSCTDLEQIKTDNNLTVQIWLNNDEYLGCFEYENWWYTVQAADKEVLISMIEGMVKYE